MTQALSGRLRMGCGESLRTPSQSGAPASFREGLLPRDAPQALYKSATRNSQSAIAKMLRSL